MIITLEQAEHIVDGSDDLHWDGWTLVQTQPHVMGPFRKDGVFMRSIRKWGIQKRYDMRADGKYNVPKAIGNDL
jgi:hypothetical protein